MKKLLIIFQSFAILMCSIRLFAQTTAPIVPDQGPFSGLERVTLISALSVSVIALWRELQKKNDLVVQTTKMSMDHANILEKVVLALEKQQESLEKQNTSLALLQSSLEKNTQK